MFNVSKFPLIQRIRSARRISGAGEKLRKLYYWKETGLLFHRVETEKLIKSVKLNKYFFLQARSRNTRVNFYYYLFIYRW